MRCMVRVKIPVQTGNARIVDGSLPQIMQSILGELKPEAAYFMADRGIRTALLFIDVSDVSRIPPIAEPFFLALGASVEFVPCMNVDELGKGIAGTEAAIKKYGKFAG